MRFHGLHTIVLVAATAALAAAPAEAQERRPERHVEERITLTGPSRLEMALRRREELGLTDEQVRRLEAARAEAERQVDAILNARQREELGRGREHFHGLRRPLGHADADCERSEDGKRVECRRIVIGGGPGEFRMHGMEPGRRFHLEPGEIRIHGREPGRRFRMEHDGPRGRLRLPSDTAGANCETRTEGNRKITVCRTEVSHDREAGRRR